MGMEADTRESLRTMNTMDMVLIMISFTAILLTIIFVEIFIISLHILSLN